MRRIILLVAIDIIINNSVVSCLDIVPYIRTFVQYDGTFGASDQGQTLDV